MNMAARPGISAARFEKQFGHDLEVIRVGSKKDRAAEACRFEKIVPPF